MNTHRNAFGLLACLTLATGWTACSNTVIGDDPDPDDTTNTSEQLMRRATSCEDLEEALKADARARLRLMMQNDSAGSDGWDSGGPDAGAGGMGGSGGMAGSGGASTGGSAGSGSTPPPNPGEYTGTNTQVKTVDEADFVKTDGSRIYQLRQGNLHIAKAWPAPELALQSSVAIEGQPIEMFLVGDAGSPDQKLVIYSQVDGTEIYAQAGLEPPTSGAEPEEPWGVGGSPGWEEPTQPTGVVLLTKITIVSVSGPSPAVIHERYLDGDYVASRRSDLLVRTVLQVAGNMPELRTVPTEADIQKAEMVVISRLIQEGQDVADVPSEELDTMVRDALGEVLVQENEAAIEAISYEDWLPHAFEKPNGEIVTTAVACEDFYVPKPGTSPLGIMHVAPLDLANLSGPATGSAIIGVAETLYQNESAMVLASSAFDGNYENPSWSTYVHAFDVQGLPVPEYKASGVVNGRIVGQFALDQKDGFVRIVTTSGERWTVQETANHLFVLEAQEGELKVVGDAGAFAQSEEVYAVRYVGNTAYVVTFRQTDPLFAIDLSNPRAPTILGELHIPGFSEYMHPLGDTHLLTVGRDADPNTGWSQNLALQVFDVTDRTHPQLAHKLVFDNYGVSAAEYDHKAFTFFESRNLLAIPYTAESYDEVTWTYRISSSMELFRVEVQQGITPLGAMSGDPLLSDAERDPEHYTCYPPYYYGYEMGSAFQRGIFMDDVLYGIGRDGIVAANTAQPDQPLGVLQLSDPAVVPDFCYEGGYGGAGGSAGAAGAGGSGGSAGDTGGSAGDTGGSAGEAGGWGGDTGGTGGGSGGFGGS